MDTRIENINELMQKLDSDGLLWPAVVVCFVIIFLLLWFLSRGVRLWYWKVNAQVDALKSIDVKLQELEGGLKAGPASAGISGPAVETLVLEMEKEMPEPLITCGEGEPGKVFTEEELEKLIRD